MIEFHLNYVIVGMEEEVGRQRLRRESVAYSSARAERAKNCIVPPTCPRGRIKEVSSTAENHPEPVADHELEIHSEPNPQFGENYMEEEEENEEVEEQEDDDYVEEEVCNAPFSLISESGVTS
jgi:hypothetical protein